jgi:hypothetical protein
LLLIHILTGKTSFGCKLPVIFSKIANLFLPGGSARKHMTTPVTRGALPHTSRTLDNR